MLAQNVSYKFSIEQLSGNVRVVFAALNEMHRLSLYTL